MSSRTARLPAAADTAPFSQLNITPLIDVLLVLLVMLILTIPTITHQVPVELPASGGDAAPATRHALAITADGGLTWDGAALADAALPARLAGVARNEATLTLETDAAARYDRFDAVLAQVKRAGVVRLGFVGNERYRAF